MNAKRRDGRFKIAHRDDRSNTLRSLFGHALGKHTGTGVCDLRDVMRNAESYRVGVHTCEFLARRLA